MTLMGKISIVQTSNRTQESEPMSDTHEVRELRFKVKQLARQSGKQGQTIHQLRAELAEVRELNSKLDRGELRRLQRFEVTAKEQFELDKSRMHHAVEALQRLREKLEGVTDADVADIRRQREKATNE
jgi:hypothetical protein